MTRAKKKRPRLDFYPCGCSALKVKVGLCDIYTTKGEPRRRPVRT